MSVADTSVSDTMQLVAFTAALDLLQGMAVFYSKYHLLPTAESAVLGRELKTTRRSFAEAAHAAVVEQQHVDIVRYYVHDLRGHFEEWMTEPSLGHRKWLVHPRDEFNLLLSDAARTLTALEALLPTSSLPVEGRKRRSVSWSSQAEQSRYVVY